MTIPIQLKEFYFKEYEFEKSNQEKRKIIMKKEQPFKSVYRILDKYKQNKPSIGWDSVFKLYLTQNYPIESVYFNGTQYSNGTLNAFKSSIKTFTKSNDMSVFTTSSVGSTKAVIAEFIGEIKSLIDPFTFLNALAPKASISKLIQSKVLNEAELEAVNREIHEYKPVKEVIDVCPVSIVNNAKDIATLRTQNKLSIRSQKNQKHVRLSSDNALIVNYLIYKNFNVAIEELHRALRTEGGLTCSVKTPTLKRKQYFVRDLYELNNEGKVNSYSDVKKIPNEILRLIWYIENKIGRTLSVELLKTMSIEDLREMITQEPIIDNVKKSIEKQVNDIFENKVDTTTEKYLLVNENNEIVKENTSLDYLRGCKDLYKDLNNQICKIYKMVEVVD